MRAGQAQKEFFINQAFAIIDQLLQSGVIGIVSASPASPVDGDAYIVAPGATGEFAGKENNIAMRIAGSWSFVAPPTGMQLFDRQDRRLVIFESEWLNAGAPPDPQGGTVIDVEARAAIDSLIQALRNARIFSPVSP